MPSFLKVKVTASPSDIFRTHGFSSSSFLHSGKCGFLIVWISIVLFPPFSPFDFEFHRSDHHLRDSVADHGGSGVVYPLAAC